MSCKKNKQSAALLFLTINSKAAYFFQSKLNMLNSANKNTFMLIFA